MAEFEISGNGVKQLHWAVALVMLDALPFGLVRPGESVVITVCELAGRSFVGKNGDMRVQLNGRPGVA